MIKTSSQTTPRSLSKGKWFEVLVRSINQSINVHQANKLSLRPKPVVDVVHLVEDDPLQIPDNVAAVVQHGPENFGGHDETGGFLIDLHVPGDETDVLERRLKVTKFLIGKRLYG